MSGNPKRAASGQKMGLSREFEPTCSACHQRLLIKKSWLSCRRCGRSWEHKDGMILARTGDYYWNDLAEDDTETLLRVAESEGWEAALHGFMRERYPRVYALACDPSRADWRFQAMIGGDSAVLDWGCGWGANVIALAESCRSVVGVDATFPRLSFVNIRRKQQRLDNLQLIHASEPEDLPLAPASFDAASLIGVLEWVGTCSRLRSPQQAQMAVLKKIHQLLKPSGVLYLGIENRIGFNYFVGAKDHCGLPFTSLMPRMLADLVTRLFRHERYVTYTYTLGGYRHLLRQCGYSQVEFLLPVPSYQMPYFLAPLEDAAVLDEFLTTMLLPRRSRSGNRDLSYQVGTRAIRLAHLARLMSLAKYFVPSFSILATKE